MRRTVESVNHLIRVAYHKDAFDMFSTKCFYEFILSSVKVLSFIYKYMFELCSVDFCAPRLFHEYAMCIYEDIIKIYTPAFY